MAGSLGPGGAALLRKRVGSSGSTTSLLGAAGPGPRPCWRLPAARPRGGGRFHAPRGNVPGVPHSSSISRSNGHTSAGGEGGGDTAPGGLSAAGAPSSRGVVPLPEDAEERELWKNAGSADLPAVPSSTASSHSDLLRADVQQRDVKANHEAAPLSEVGAGGSEGPAAGGVSQEDLAEVRNSLRLLQDVVSEQRNIIKTQDSKILQLQASLVKEKRVREEGCRVDNPAEAINPVASASRPVAKKAGWDPNVNPFEAQRVAVGDRRLLGMFDSRFHSASGNATPTNYRILPPRIILVRHAESMGNVDHHAYTYTPDPQVPLTDRGWQQARAAGAKIRNMLDEEHGDSKYQLFCYMSPYRRSTETLEGILDAFDPDVVTGIQESVQLREQDFGNFQNASDKLKEKEERQRFGRFFYRFPNGESGADVYDRITIFEDHLIRDINAGRFQHNSTLVLITHGLALRIFLMRWFHWNVDQFLRVWNPPNAEPLVLERVIPEVSADDGNGESSAGAAWVHTKALYRLQSDCRLVIKGCTEDMCTTPWLPSGVSLRTDDEKGWDTDSEDEALFP